MLRLCILASGSAGNCMYIASRNSALLIDAGLSARETLRRMDLVGIDSSSVNAICLTHEHSDHISGLPALCRKLDVSVYANSGTVDAVERALGPDRVRWQVFTTGSQFSIGDMTVEPFSVPHDSYDPVGFAIQSENTRIGVATDLGMPTSLIRHHLKGCNALVLEANHSERMLKNAKRPWSLKQRIMGRQGHLSNTSTAQLVADLAQDTLSHVYLAHLSSDCNTPDKAVQTVVAELNARSFNNIMVIPALQGEPSQIWESDARPARDPSG
ncbi:MAG: MBL fold metallo-hydrolase [Lentisphaerales bacterium]|jgi:phosphoribosyl 1,2-cyclic phosphodiesterase|nr:MAG: MBL fold metallo-hydrolase [Lentisphaerales bacterium]